MDKREEILYKEFDAISEDCRTRKEDLQLAITLNPDVDKIINAMDAYSKKVALAFYEHIEGVPEDQMEVNFDFFIDKFNIDGR